MDAVDAGFLFLLFFLFAVTHRSAPVLSPPAQPCPCGRTAAMSRRPCRRAACSTTRSRRSHPRPSRNLSRCLSAARSLRPTTTARPLLLPPPLLATMPSRSRSSRCPRLPRCLRRRRPRRCTAMPTSTRPPWAPCTCRSSSTPPHRPMCRYERLTVDRERDGVLEGLIAPGGFMLNQQPRHHHTATTNLGCVS